MQIKRVSFVLAVFASAFVAGCNKETPSAKSAVEPKRIRELEARMEHLETELKERTEYLDMGYPCGFESHRRHQL